MEFHKLLKEQEIHNQNKLGLLSEKAQIYKRIVNLKGNLVIDIQMIPLEKRENIQKNSK